MKNGILATCAAPRLLASADARKWMLADCCKPEAASIAVPFCALSVNLSLDRKRLIMAKSPCEHLMNTGGGNASV